ncbi:MAG: hypothetical protein V4582_09405 [Pseudomonadota bacterium]
MIPHVRTLSLILGAAALAACSPKPADAPKAPAAVPSAAIAAANAIAASAKPDQFSPLMQAIFPKYRPASHDALAELPSFEDAKQKDFYLVTAVASTLLTNGETVLVANAEPANAAGESTSSHADGGGVNVYFLRQEAGKWVLLRRQENIAVAGSMGNFGGVEFINLSTTKRGFLVLGGGTWQGSTIEALSIFDLTMPIMRELTDKGGIRLSSDNEGGCEQDKGDCWSVNGKWHFDAPKPGATYAELVIDFSGTLPAAAQEGGSASASANGSASAAAKAAASATAQDKALGKARYAFDGTAFRLIDGKNAAPEI